MWYGLLCPFCDSVCWDFFGFVGCFFVGRGREVLAFFFPLYLIYFKVASTVNA